MLEILPLINYTSTKYVAVGLRNGLREWNRKMESWLFPSKAVDFYREGLKKRGEVFLCYVAACITISRGGGVVSLVAEKGEYITCAVA